MTWSIGHCCSGIGPHAGLPDEQRQMHWLSISHGTRSTNAALWKQGAPWSTTWWHAAGSAACCCTCYTCSDNMRSRGLQQHRTGSHDAMHAVTHHDACAQVPRTQTPRHLTCEHYYRAWSWRAASSGSRRGFVALWASLGTIRRAWPWWAAGVVPSRWRIRASHIQRWRHHVKGLCRCFEYRFEAL